MIHASMLDFARTGKLGPLHCGMTRQALRELLGEPPNWTANDPLPVTRIWRYGDIEFHFEPTRDAPLHMIFTDHDNLTGASAKIQIDPWIVQKGLSRAQFEAELLRMGLLFKVTQPEHDANQRIVTTSAGVEFVFIENAEEGNSRAGLVAWSSRIQPTEKLAASIKL